MALDIAKFKDLFISEAEEHVVSLSRTLLKIESEPEHLEFYEELMRSAHTIKGSAATMGYTEIAQLAHALEDVFHAGERSAFTVDAAGVTTLLHSVDILTASLRAIKVNDAVIDTSKEVLALRALLVSPAKFPIPKPTLQKIESDSVTEIIVPDIVKVHIDRLDTLMGIFEELLMLRLKFDTMLEPAEETARTTTDPALKQRLFFVNEFRSLFIEMSHLLSENQDALLAIRLVTLDQIFGQYPRMVRDLAVRQGKKIEFVVQGGSIALDRTVIDGLGGALSHLLRNAIDHGIVDSGTITLYALREKGRAKVIVEDNGAGINYDRVKSVAIERGVETKERIDAMKKSAIAELLFHPNMSTNDVVTDISGRGVGVSAVYAFARDIGGRLDVISPIPELGLGTRFTLDLPVSLATIRVLIVEASGYTFAIPFDNIERTHEYAKSDISGVAHQETLLVDGALLPLIHLERVLALAYDGYQPPASKDAHQIAVLVHTRTTRLAIGVDVCKGEQDLIVKSLPPILRDIKGFSGSALLPDGRTILLIDVQGLLAHTVSDILEHTNIS